MFLEDSDAVRIVLDLPFTSPSCTFKTKIQPSYSSEIRSRMCESFVCLQPESHILIRTLVWTIVAGTNSADQWRSTLHPKIHLRIQTGKFVQASFEGAVAPSLLSDELLGGFASYEGLSILFDEAVKDSFMRGVYEVSIYAGSSVETAIPESPDRLKHDKLQFLLFDVCDVGLEGWGALILLGAHLSSLDECLG
jgi:hypothetical protein